MNLLFLISVITKYTHSINIPCYRSKTRPYCKIIQFLSSAPLVVNNSIQLCCCEIILFQKLLWKVHLKVQVNCLFCKIIKEWFTKKGLDIINLSIILQALLIAFDIIIPPSQRQIQWQQTGFGSVLPAAVAFLQRCMESSPVLHKAKTQANK